MSDPLTDAAVRRLGELVDWPDFSDTKYEIVERIGRGGMGTVYRAHDRTLDRAVAIKVLSVPDAGGELATRLTREARILAGLEHPGLVPVHDVGVLADGRPFYVMKLVRGHRLDDSVRAMPGRVDRLRVFLRICDAVAFAHSAGVIHRDLKPENVMVGAFGEVLVLDWGVARRLGDSISPSTDATGPGTVLGTLGFMAPELAAGQADQSDARTDVFALGAILRLLATVDGECPRPVAAICERAQIADPAGRYPSVGELAADVQRYTAGEPVSAYREGAMEQVGRLVAKHRTAVALVGVYVIVRIILMFA